VRTLRIALDATPLLGLPTGVGAFTAGVLTSLADRDDVEIAAYALTWRGRGTLPGAVPPGVRVVDRPMPARPLRSLWRRADTPRVERWTGTVDVVHGTNFVVPPARAAEIVTVHDLTALRFPELCDRQTLAFPQLIRRALRRGAWIHAPSAHVAAEVREAFAVPTDRVVVVHEGVPAVDAAPAGAGQRLAGADRYVLALGTIEPRKDHAGLLAAFEAVAARDGDLRLVLAGGRGWGVEAFDAALARSPVRDRVVLLGYVDASHRAALLRDAAVLAFPSRYEGFGLPPLEAMSVGVPVVATAAGALPEVLGDAAILVPPGDRDALAEALSSALHDDGRRQRLVRAGAAQAARYSWDACAEGLVAVYRAAVAQRKSGG
jgi:glycosyltransferase involved in cell wall biosynthesis